MSRKPDMDVYSRNGFCVVPGVLSAQELDPMRRLLAEAQQQFLQGEGDARWLNDPTAWEVDEEGRRQLRRVSKPFERSAEFRSVFGGDKILDLVECFVGPDIYLHSSKMLYKPPGRGRRKPFHQDMAYWEDMTAPQVTLWCPITPVDADNGCMEVVPASHLDGLLPHYDLDDWQVDESFIDPATVQVVPMQAGDVLFIHPLVLHASRVNRSPRDRLAAVINYYSLPRAAGQRYPYGSDEPLRRKSMAGVGP